MMHHVSPGTIDSKDYRKEHTTVVTAADTVTPDASFTSPLLAIDKHFRGLLNGEHATVRDE